MYLWESDDGIVHQIEQGEGSEQGDPLMPLGFALGQHASLCAIDEGLAEGERLMAFLDDVYISTSPEGLQQAYGGAERVWRHVRIRVHEGKTQVWNSGGVRPEFCDVLERIAQIADPEVRVWKGSGVPTTDQGIRVLGTPLGHADYVETQLRERLDDHQLVVEPNSRGARSPVSVGSPSTLHLSPCKLHVAGGQAGVGPGYAEGHDRGLWTCMCRLLGTDIENTRSRELASVPLSLGGLGLRSATRTREAAYWTSFADCLFMVRNRHPVMVDRILDALNCMDALESTRSAAVAAIWRVLRVSKCPRGRL